jgi:putative ABC transport system substrate-binding protein
MMPQGKEGDGWVRRRPGIIALLLMGSVWLAVGVGAADRAHPVRIGVLTASWGVTPPVVGLRDGLLELGYREDRDFVFGVRFTQGDLTALPGAARELVHYGVDLIFTSENNPAVAAQQATTEIPIVFTGVNDPVRLGLVQSFARPGGNITGVTELYANLGPKRLEVFRDMLPVLKRVLMPYDAADTITVRELKVHREAARALGIELVERAVHTQQEAQKLLALVRKGDVDGILSPRCCSLNLPGFILEATSKQGIPAMFDARFWVERGALASYGPDYYASGKQAARLVDKILQGATPAEIPVEVNSKIEFSVNVKTAKALGLTIPPEVLFRADRIVR